MNEKDLISQFETDISNFTGMDIKKNILHNSEMQKFLKKPSSEWMTDDFIIISRMKKNSLILIDESHYGSDQKQVLNQFLTKILNISPNGDNEYLSKNNIYVVSISATPMAEFINANISEFKKKIIPLKNSNGYYGISDMFNNGRIEKSFDFKDNKSIDRFIDSILKIGQIGYILVRCSEKQKVKIINRIGERVVNDFNKPIDYDRHNKSRILDNMGINDILLQKPNKKTIIFLKGLLRAGQRVETENIIMTHDTAESNVDTTVQSLLGRCCGYNKNKNIKIYCDSDSARKYKDWIESGYNLTMVPDKSKNVPKLKDIEKLVKVTTLCEPKEFNSNLIIDNIMSCRKRQPNWKIEVLKSLNDKFIDSLLDNTEYAIGTIYPVNINDSSYEKWYLSPLRSKTYFGDYKPKDNEIGNYVFSGAYDANEPNNKKILIHFGKIISIESEIIVSEKSMYDKTNKIKMKMKINLEIELTNEEIENLLKENEYISKEEDITRETSDSKGNTTHTKGITTRLYKDGIKQTKNSNKIIEDILSDKLKTILLS